MQVPLSVSTARRNLYLTTEDSFCIAMAMFEKLTEVSEAFRLPGTFYAFDTIKNGNINSTYKVTYREPNGRLKSYIVQKIMPVGIAGIFLAAPMAAVMSTVSSLLITRSSAKYPLTRIRI